MPTNYFQPNFPRFHNNLHPMKSVGTLESDKTGNVPPAITSSPSFLLTDDDDEADGVKDKPKSRFRFHFCSA